MASRPSLQEILEEAKCTLCCRYLKDPMTTCCGHNFCRVCIHQYWENWDELLNGPLFCPSCRVPIQKGDLRNHRQLATIVEQIKDQSSKQREENLNLSCEEDGEAMCLVCKKSAENRSHTEEVAQKDKDVGVHLIRGETRILRKLSEIFPELKNSPSDSAQEPRDLVETLRTFRANVTLDPDTAHPWLVLSADGKAVQGTNRLQDLPNNPERFDSRTCVLGREGFISGRSWWEVEVGDGRCWAVGVARESVERKGWTSFYPEEGIWGVEMWWGHFRTLSKPQILLPRLHVPRRIRVCLDCKRGQVAIFNPSDLSWICIFPPGSVPRERMRPWFWVWWDVKPQLRLCP